MYCQPEIENQSDESKKRKEKKRKKERKKERSKSEKMASKQKHKYKERCQSENIKVVSTHAGVLSQKVSSSVLKTRSNEQQEVSVNK